MAIIGTFTKQGDTYRGSIRTLAFSVPEAVIKPVAKTSDAAPGFRVFAGSAEIGAAWEQVGEEKGTVYLSLKLDDPSLLGPIRANLFKDSKGDDYSLIWTRKAE